VRLKGSVILDKPPAQVGAGNHWSIAARALRLHAHFALSSCHVLLRADPAVTCDRVLLSCGAQQLALPAAAAHCGAAAAAALHIATIQGQSAVVDVLLAASAAVESDCQRVRPLVPSTGLGRTAVVTQLWTAGAAVGSVDLKGFFAPAIAAGQEHTPVVQVLLVAGAPTSSQQLTEDDALQAACEEGHVPVVQLLLTAG
jgi:ankyrin repeat protein